MYIAESNVFLLYFMSMHCNCCAIALFSHLGYYFIKHTSLHFTPRRRTRTRPDPYPRVRVGSGRPAHPN